jgi:hypothetical protein
MAAAFCAAANGRASSVHWRNTNLITVGAAKPKHQEIGVGGRFLSVVFVRPLAEVASFVCESDQTITYIGCERSEIQSIAASRAAPGVSAWAPIGTALDFDFIWDGYDIPFELTRLVRRSSPAPADPGSAFHRAARH